MVQLLYLPKGKRRRKGTEKRVSALHNLYRAAAPFSLPTSQVSEPTRLNHTVTNEIHICVYLHAHTHFFIPSGMIHDYPPHSPWGAVTQGERSKKKGQNTIQ